MAEQIKTVSRKTTHIVSQYFTPLAILLVGNGLVVAPPPSPAREIVIGLLALSIIFNHLSVSWIEDAPVAKFWKLQARVWVNIIINIALVYLLSRHWPPIWLLLMLSPVATALYGSYRQTILTASVAAAALLAIKYAYGEDFSAAAWAQQMIQGCFIFLLSLALYKFTQVPKDDSD